MPFAYKRYFHEFRSQTRRGVSNNRNTGHATCLKCASGVLKAVALPPITNACRGHFDEGGVNLVRQVLEAASKHHTEKLVVDSANDDVSV